MEYIINFSVNLGEVLPSVGEVCQSVNNIMADFGFDEKLMVRSKCLSASLTVERELTDEEKNTIAQVIINQFHINQQTWKVRIESFNGPNHEHIYENKIEK